jgi:hypothetical protein
MQQLLSSKRTNPRALSDAQLKDSVERTAEILCAEVAAGVAALAEATKLRDETLKRAEAVYTLSVAQVQQHTQSLTDYYRRQLPEELLRRRSEYAEKLSSLQVAEKKEEVPPNVPAPSPSVVAPSPSVVAASIPPAAVSQSAVGALQADFSRCPVAAEHSSPASPLPQPAAQVVIPVPAKPEAGPKPPILFIDPATVHETLLVECKDAKGTKQALLTFVTRDLGFSVMWSKQIGAGLIVLRMQYRKQAMELLTAAKLPLGEHGEAVFYQHEEMESDPRAGDTEEEIRSHGSMFNLRQAGGRVFGHEA